MDWTSHRMEQIPASGTLKMLEIASKLEAAGYLEVKKEFLGKKPHTEVSLTKKGREAFEAYRKDIQKVLEVKYMAQVCGG